MRVAVFTLELAIVLTMPLQSAVAQTSRFSAGISAKPHVPTQTECIDALNTGKLLGYAPDGRFILVKGELVYWVFVSPAYVECDAAQYTPSDK